MRIVLDHYVNLKTLLGTHEVNIRSLWITEEQARTIISDYYLLDGDTHSIYRGLDPIMIERPDCQDLELWVKS